MFNNIMYKYTLFKFTNKFIYNTQLVFTEFCSLCTFLQTQTNRIN